MSNTLQAIRGMNDLLPEQTGLWQHVEQSLRDLLGSYGYQEIRTPIVEKTELFKRSIGEATDIVEKEMYTFDDRNDDSLTLRPEGTASCLRAAMQHGLLHNQQPQRLWYMGPMFRHERPQKGRYRQFHQFGVETFGMSGPDIDAELILMTARLWRQLNMPNLTLEINSLGSAESRAAYRDILVDYFQTHYEQLDEDSCSRLKRNPLRILDSKNPDMAGLISAAPSFADHIDTESADHFSRLQEMLTASGVDFVVNPLLVRGLDYYGKTVFEWITNELGAQGTVCAGGRYDSLVDNFGGKPTPAVGFAIGIERLISLLELNKDSLPEKINPHAYFITLGDLARQQGLRIAEQLRNDVPGLRLTTHCGDGSFKSQFKRADRSGANLGLILGEDEVKNNQISIKYLRDQSKEQLQKPQSELAGWLRNHINT